MHYVNLFNLEERKKERKKKKKKNKNFFFKIFHFKICFKFVFNTSIK